MWLFIFKEGMPIKPFSLNLNRKQFSFWDNFCTFWLSTQTYLQFFSDGGSNAYIPDQLFITTLKLCDSNGNYLTHLLGHKGVGRLK